MSFADQLALTEPDSWTYDAFKHICQNGSGWYIMDGVIAWLTQAATNLGGPNCPNVILYWAKLELQKRAKKGQNIRICEWKGQKLGNRGVGKYFLKKDKTNCLFRRSFCNIKQKWPRNA